MQTKKFWGILAATVRKCKVIHSNGPELNCYHAALLCDDRKTKFIAILTACAQIVMTIFIMANFYFSDTENMSDFSAFYSLKSGIPFTIIVTLICTMLVKMQVENAEAFYGAFPDKCHHWTMYLDYIINIVVGYLLCVLNIFVLGFSETFFDLVMNSVAVIFIIEMDDACVFVDEDGKFDLYRKYLLNDLQNAMNSLDPKYFSPKSEMYKIYQPYGKGCELKTNKEMEELEQLRSKDETSQGFKFLGPKVLPANGDFHAAFSTEGLSSKYKPYVWTDNWGAGVRVELRRVGGLPINEGYALHSSRRAGGFTWTQVDGPKGESGDYVFALVIDGEGKEPIAVTDVIRFQ